MLHNRTNKTPVRLPPPSLRIGFFNERHNRSTSIFSPRRGRVSVGRCSGKTRPAPIGFNFHCADDLTNHRQVRKMCSILTLRTALDAFNPKARNVEQACTRATVPSCPGFPQHLYRTQRTSSKSRVDRKCL